MLCTLLNCGRCLALYWHALSKLTAPNLQATSSIDNETDKLIQVSAFFSYSPLHTLHCIGWHKNFSLNVVQNHIHSHDMPTLPIQT